MLSILKNRTFAALFGAQVIALLGTGLLTVALGLLAYDLAGPAAGAVLGTAYTIKMVAYVGLAPVANAIAEKLPRKALLIGADLMRAAIAVALPFITEIWQIYGLIFILQAASATFTPAFQATIPDVLPDEADYTRALSLSRLAYDLENLLSPAMAGVLLLVTSYHGLFVGTVIGFIGSAALVGLSKVPERRSASKPRTFIDRVTRGSRIYLATPRLRGLLGLNMVASGAGAFILVNSVVMVRDVYGLGESDLAVAMAAFGAGSMATALMIPRLLDTVPERRVMLQAGRALAIVTLLHAGILLVGGAVGWTAFLLLWALSGALYSAILTPSGRLLRRSAQPEDRPSVFAAQFALSHACWLITYPIAGWAGSLLSLPIAMLVLGVIALASVVAAARLWPTHDPDSVFHSHDDLPPDHPHLQQHPSDNGAHSHGFVIDDEHLRWPGIHPDQVASKRSP